MSTKHISLFFIQIIMKIFLVIRINAFIYFSYYLQKNLETSQLQKKGIEKKVKLRQFNKFKKEEKLSDLIK